MMIGIKPLLQLFTVMIITSSAFAENDKNPFIDETAPLVAFTNARVIDGTGAPAKENHTVVIKDGRIVSIGRDGEVKIPQKAKRISLQGKSLLPGWVMHHEHLYYLNNTRSSDPLVLTQQSFNFPRLYLSAGITSARTAGSIEPYTDLRIRERIEAGLLPGPTLDLTAPYLEGNSDSRFFQLHGLNSADEARDMVRYWASRGFTSFKAYNHISREYLAVAIDEVHKLGLKITGHLCSVTFKEAADLGIDQLEHGFFSSTDFDKDKKPDSCGHSLKPLPNPEEPEAKELIRYLVEKEVVLTSTIAIFARQANMMSEVPSEFVALLQPEGRARYQQVIAQKGESEYAQSLRSRVESDMKLQAAFWRAGGQLVVGTDPTGVVTLPGYGSLMSIELLADAGIPPLEVIKIATQNGAQAMGVLDDRGTIALGKRADLLVIKGDPSVDIKAIHKIETVFKNGIGYNPEALRKSAIGTVGGPG